MTIDEKIRAVSEKIDGHKSLIAHILLQDNSIGIDYSDPNEMEMINQFVISEQEKIVFLEGLLEDLKNGIDQLG
jgi:hypothetical protein